ncbi:hypothetical protein ACIF8T_25195 [Streptomyces sp. NPDC085946]|uniref:hypothetical protein n=1 Tax=Streptomyces sp. NPDC085946 TaxID=3365744 RepID=UPI0037CD8145
MNVRIRGNRLALAALAAGTALALAAVPATAAGSPRFLEPGELPPHPASPWYAGPVTAGQPEHPPVCVGEALPSVSSHREYWTEYDTNAFQVTVVERSEQRAKAFAALLRQKIGECAERLMAETPGLTATEKYYGKIDVEEGATVHGLQTVSDWGSSDVALFSVGRDGRTVTYVRWAQLGTFEHAQVEDFKATTATAVDKLY